MRYLSYTIDTVLLTAALMLRRSCSVSVRARWLTVKVALVVYIVLGSFALKRARTPRVRLGSCRAAILVYGMVISVARSHDPYGMLAPLRAIAYGSLLR